MKLFKQPLNSKGFTLPELLISATVLVLTFSGILVTFIGLMELDEVSQNMSAAVQGVKSKMEEVRNTDFALIEVTHDETNFIITGVNGMGVVYVDDTDPNLLEITISFSWQQTSGRIYGEDLNLDGDLDAGEDSNGNGILDSPVSLVSLVYNE